MPCQEPIWWLLLFSFHRRRESCWHWWWCVSSCHQFPKDPQWSVTFVGNNRNSSVFSAWLCVNHIRQFTLWLWNRGMAGPPNCLWNHVYIYKREKESWQVIQKDQTFKFIQKVKFRIEMAVCDQNARLHPHRTRRAWFACFAPVASLVLSGRPQKDFCASLSRFSSLFQGKIEKRNGSCGHIER